MRSEGESRLNGLFVTLWRLGIVLDFNEYFDLLKKSYRAGLYEEECDAD